MSLCGVCYGEIQDGEPMDEITMENIKSHDNAIKELKKKVLKYKKRLVEDDLLVENLEDKEDKKKEKVWAKEYMVNEIKRLEKELYNCNTNNENYYKQGKAEVGKAVVNLLRTQDYMICRFCGTIAYGDGNCHCGKSFKTDENWIFAIDLFKKELKSKINEYPEKAETRRGECAPNLSVLDTRERPRHIQGKGEKLNG